jgi:hypothetical protein
MVVGVVAVTARNRRVPQVLLRWSGRGAQFRPGEVPELRRISALLRSGANHYFPRPNYVRAFRTLRVLGRKLCHQSRQLSRYVTRYRKQQAGNSAPQRWVGVEVAKLGKTPGKTPLPPGALFGLSTTTRPRRNAIRSIDVCLAAGQAWLPGVIWLKNM